MIRIKNLVKKYEEVAAVNDICLDVKEGETNISCSKRYGPILKWHPNR